MKLNALKPFLAQFLVITFTTLAAAQDITTVLSTEVIYGHKDGVALTFDVFEPDVEPNGAAVVFIVSGGWFSKWNPPEQTRVVLSPFLAAGYKGFAVRHGSSPRYSIAEAAADVPPSDLTNYVWSTPGLNNQYRQFPGLNIAKEEAKSVSPLYFVTADDAPCLVISGGKDTLVLPEQGRWIHEKMDEIGVENKFVLYENSGHGLENDMSSAVAESLQWFDAHLK